VQAFIDENTVRGIMVVAAVADPSALEYARRTLAELRMKGQERIHFKSERDSRRRAICSALVTLDVQVRVYHAAGLTPKLGRPRCLETLVGDLAELPISRLVLEQDDSTVKSDRRVLFEAAGKHGIRDQLTYQSAGQAGTDAVDSRCGGVVPGQRRGVARSGPPVDYQDHDGAVDTRNPAHQPSGRLPGSLHQSYCPGRHLRCQSPQ